MLLMTFVKYHSMVKIQPHRRPKRQSLLDRHTVLEEQATVEILLVTEVAVDDVAAAVAVVVVVFEVMLMVSLRSRLAFDDSLQ